MMMGPMDRAECRGISCHSTTSASGLCHPCPKQTQTQTQVVLLDAEVHVEVEVEVPGYLQVRRRRKSDGRGTYLQGRYVPPPPRKVLLVDQPSNLLLAWACAWTRHSRGTGDGTALTFFLEVLWGLVALGLWTGTWALRLGGEGGASFIFSSLSLPYGTGCHGKFHQFPSREQKGD